MNWFIKYQSWNNIGDSGIRSLSSGLKVNSCVTSLGLEICILKNGLYKVFFILLSFTTILEIQEHVHWEKWWRIIQLLHHWIWELFYKTWYMMFFPWLLLWEELYWFIRSIIIKIRIGGKSNNNINWIGIMFLHDVYFHILRYLCW